MSPVAMHELEGVTPETAIDSKELKELIARLANPNRSVQEGSVRVKDIAETLEIPESEVALELQRLRDTKKVSSVPIEAEKLAAVLDSMKSTDYQPITTRPLKRVTTASILLIVAVFFGVFLILFSLMQASPRVAPPQIAPASKLQPAHHGPKMSDDDAPQAP